MTSLRAQLRAEQRQEVIVSDYSTISTQSPCLFSSNQKTNARGVPNSEKTSTNASQQQRPYIELMSPRLSQRRVVMPIMGSNQTQQFSPASFNQGGISLSTHSKVLNLYYVFF